MSDVQRFNEARADSLRPELLTCCDVPGWAEAVLAGRPYASVDDLVAAADSAARRLTPAEVERGLAAHPRIGERREGHTANASWSREEQSAVGSDSALQQELREANRAYEERFRRVFLICASGRSGEDILASLRERLGNDEATEEAVVAEELRMIALVRLRKLLNGGVQA